VRILKHIFTINAVSILMTGKAMAAVKHESKKGFK
jgi:hypothetical protein